WQDDPVVSAAPSAVPSAPAAAVTGSARWQQDPVAPPSAAPVTPSGKEGGVMRNLGAGGYEWVASALGAPVDAASWLINKVAAPFTGRAGDEFGPATKLSVPPAMANVPQPATPHPLIENPVGGSQSIESGIGLVGADPRNVGVNNTPDAVARNM